MKPKTRRRIAVVISAVDIVYGLLIAIFSAVSIFIAVSLFSDPALAELGEEYYEGGFPVARVVSLSAVEFVLAALYVVTGVLGALASRRPSRSKRFFAASLVTTAFAAARAAVSIASASQAVLTSLICIVPAVLGVWIARELMDQDAERVAAGEEEIDPADDPSYLGLMRVIEVLFILNVLFTLVSLIYTSRNAVQYDFGNLLDWANVVFECMALWLIIKRYRAVRVFVLAFTAFNIVSGVVYGLVSGTFSIESQLFGSAFDIFLFVYFLVSKRVRRICVNEFDFKGARNPTAQNRGILDLKRLGWPFIRNLIIYYCVFSLLGHWMEAGMCQFIRLGLVDGDYDPSNTMLFRDWFYPFPMEGLAVVLIALFLYPLKNWLVKKIKVPVVPYVASFFANMMACVAIEFFMGLAVNSDHQLWNYSDMPFNFMGQVCLQNALAFGAAASVIGWVVYPLLERALSHVSNDAMNIAFVVIAAAYAIPQTLYLIDPPDGADADADTAAAFAMGAVFRGNACRRRRACPDAPFERVERLRFSRRRIAGVGLVPTRPPHGAGGC